MKRFFKALPVVLVGGLALTGCSATETPSANSGVTISITTHAEGDALGSGAVDATGAPSAGKDVLGTEANTTLAIFKQLGVSYTGFEMKAGSENGGKKQSAELTIKGVDLSALTTAQAAASKQFADAATAWQASNPTKKPAEFFTDATMLTQLGTLSGLIIAQAFPVPTEANGEHELTITPAFAQVLKAHNTEVEFTLPGSVESVTGPAGAATGEGHKLLLNADKLENGKAIKVVYDDPAPVMSWWLSTVLWILGVIVTVLIAVIALMPGKRKPQADEKTA